MPTFSSLTFLASLLVLSASPERPNFQDDILPILDQSCNSCHNPEKAKGSLILSSINDVINGGGSGDVVVPKNSNNSSLYLLASHQKEPHMPPRGQAIDDEQLKLIKTWIDQGLLPTASGKPMKKKAPTIALELKTNDLGKPKGPPPMPRSLNLEPFLITERGFTPSAMETAPWSPLIAIACPKQILIYHTETLELQAILPYPEGFAESLAFSKNGSLLLASGGKGGKSGQVVAWDIQSGRRMITLGQEKDSILTTDINPDQSLIAIGGTSKIVKVFDLGSGEVLYDISKHSEWVTQVAISPDGILMATGDRNGGLHIWEVETGNPFYTLSGHQAEITDLSWRSDGNILLSSSEDGTLHTWEMISGKKIKDWEAHPGGVLSAHFDKKANIISSGRDKRVVYWDNNGKEITTISGFKDIVTESRFSQDGQRIVAAEWTGNITVWNPLDGKQHGSLQSNPPSIKKRIRAYELKLSQVQQRIISERNKISPLLDSTQQIESQVTQFHQKKESLGKGVDSRKENAIPSVTLLQKAEVESQSLLYDIKKWKAEKINTQRHKVLATKHEIKNRIKIENRQLADLENTYNLALQVLDQKAEQLFNLPNNITKAREETVAKQAIHQESIIREKELEKKLANTLQIIEQTEGLNKGGNKEGLANSLHNLNQKISSFTSNLKSQKEQTRLTSTDHKQAQETLHGLIGQKGKLPAIIKDKKIRTQSALTSINQIHEEISKLQKMEQEKHKQAQALLEDYEQALPKR